MKTKNELLDRIGSYLGNGGLFNPEMMEHVKVRDLIRDVRDHLQSPTLERGDRIEVVNFPADYPERYRELYNNGIVDKADNGKGIVVFYSGNVSRGPFFDGKSYEVSGCGNACKVESLKFIKRAPALFWRWKDQPRTNGGQDYNLERNYWQVNHADLL